MGVLADVLRCWTAEPKGRILLIGWAATFAGVTIRAVVLQRRRKKQLTLVKKQPSTISSTETESSPAKALTPLRRMQRLAVPKWSSKPVVWCALLTTGIGLRLVVQVKTSAEVGALGSLLSKQDWPALYRRQLSYALYAVPAAVFYALQKLAAANAALAMRENLCAFVLYEARLLPRALEPHTRAPSPRHRRCSPRGLHTAASTGPKLRQATVAAALWLPGASQPLRRHPPRTCARNGASKGAQTPCGRSLWRR